MGMSLWHGTDDAPRAPRRVAPAGPVRLLAGTWPIGPDQSVLLTWDVVHFDGTREHATAAARWEHNQGANSYWRAECGPFEAGDVVTYAFQASAPGVAPVQTPSSRFRVAPMYIAWLWHHHQPLYRDPAAVAPPGSYVHPWVRLHALRDYYSMARIAAGHDVRLTVNLTPVLLQQLDDYVLHGATDRALDLTRRRARDLSADEIEEILSTFFDADWHHQIYVHARYRQLFDARTAGAPFGEQDIVDLQMWSSLAWFAHEFRNDEVALATGEIVRVRRFVDQQRGFTAADVAAMIEEQYKVMRAIVPLHRELQRSGRIELTTTPAFHPILPLLIDSGHARVDLPGASLPTRYAYPEDAAAQVRRASDDYAARYQVQVRGMWPAEAAVSDAAVRMFEGHGLRWIATDAGVLARSGRWGYAASEPEVLCQPYRASDAPEPLAIFFREAQVADAIGFQYGQFSDSRAAADDLIRTIENRYMNGLGSEEDRVLTIALDGENAWGGYADDGRPFLHALYERLGNDPRFKTVTFSEYLAGNPGRRVAPHPASALQRVYDIATGSWIDEPGSGPGVDLGTWIGEPEENLAWELLGTARADLRRAVPAGEIPAGAYDAILAAEGSDWFWWFGRDQESRNDGAFDDLFRANLEAVYRVLGIPPPDALADFIIPRPVVWTFTRPLTAIRRRDQVSIRTNCPGRVSFGVDGGAEQTAGLVAVGGVVEGARRFQVTIGPFAPPARTVRFRFVCEHAGCPGGDLCRLGAVHEITIGRSRSRRPDAAV
jgi:alpha-amylase/alpha-mannosidase (GH57 family)